MRGAGTLAVRRLVFRPLVPDDAVIRVLHALAFPLMTLNASSREPHVYLEVYVGDPRGVPKPA